MSQETKYFLTGVLIAAAFSIGGYFVYPKINSSNSHTQTPVLPQEEPVFVAPDTSTSTVGTATEPQPETPTKATAATPKPTPIPEGTDQFTVSLTATNIDIATNLTTTGYITDTNAFAALLDKEKNSIIPGAYKISKEMTPPQLHTVLHGKPYMKWVSIKEGLRKEEIATLLASTLGWNAAQKKNFVDVATAANPDYREGVYFPNTYLIPVAEDPTLVAKRLISKFNENFGAYQTRFTAKNIKWTTGLTLASIVQREASNAADMPLIAGILWNRLNQNIALGVDATLQYIRGDKGQGWWAPITVTDKQIDSPYNTYKYKGLPPHPISNPGLSAINAALNPTETDCIYYIHDKNRVTHCAVTYEEHQSNIQKYLIDGQTQ